MKRSTLFVALTLAASMLLTSTSAFALTWSSALETTYGGSAGQRIDNVSISLTDDIYNIALTLGDKPVNGTIYSVLLGDSAEVLNDFDYYLDAEAQTRRNKLTVAFSAGNFVTEESIPFGAEWDDNKLTWLIDKSDLFDGSSFWFAGQSANTDGTTIYSRTQASATPIPGAAWLLGSGVLGLVALRRKKAGMA